MPEPVSLSTITAAIDATVGDLNSLTGLTSDAQLERDELVLHLQGISKTVQALAKCAPGDTYIPRWSSGSGQSS
jgi:hypothetical protein